MCTVTYIPLKENDFILTSNRDETPLRKTIFPKEYIENGVALTYPKDELAGGTWIGTSDKKRLVCLLNGGYRNHERILPYRMSRGIIVKNILSVENPVEYITEFDFEKIEPFTLILVDWSRGLDSYELVWDGLVKHFKKMLPEPKIWSSATLYNGEMKALRENWFASWLEENKKVPEEKILEFHKNESLGNPEISPKMKRLYVQTLSTTSVKKIKNNVSMKYFDFLKESSKSIDL